MIYIIHPKYIRKLIKLKLLLLLWKTYRERGRGGIKERCLLVSFNHTNEPLNYLLYVSLRFGVLFWFIIFKDSRIDKNTRVLFRILTGSRLGFFPLLSVEFLYFLGDFDVSSEMMKRDSVSVGFDQSLGVDDGAMAKLKYQTLVGEFLELQKEFVSRKRKLHAAKQKRETILAEVGFLRRRRNDLLPNQAFNTEKDPVHLSNSCLKSNSLKGEISFHGPEAMSENSNRFLLSDSHNGDTEGVRDNKVDLKQLNSISRYKTTGKRKISWPAQVTLNF